MRDHVIQDYIIIFDNEKKIKVGKLKALKFR